MTSCPADAPPPLDLLLALALAVCCALAMLAARNLDRAPPRLPLAPLMGP